MIDSNTKDSINIEGISLIEITKNIIERFKLFPINIEDYQQKEIHFKQMQKEFFDAKIVPLTSSKLNRKLSQNERFKFINDVSFLRVLSHFYTKGYFLGQCVFKLFEHDCNNRVFDSCAIIYLTSCVSDYIIDNQNQFFPGFINKMIKGLNKIFGNFNIQYVPELTQNSHPNSDELIIHIIDNFLMTIKENVLSKKNFLVKELKSIMELALKAQIIRYRSIEIKYSSYKEIYKFLRIRNSFLAWGIGLICLLNTKTKHINELFSWKDLFLNIGDIFWLIDDITDYAEDYLNQKWNYLILRASSQALPSLGVKYPDFSFHKSLYCRIHNGFIIHSCIYELFSKLIRIIEVYEKTTQDSSCFKNLVYSFMKQHFYHIVSLPVPEP